MHTATPRLGLLAVLVLLAAPAWAQEYQITFQVDMTSAIENCALDPDSDQVVSVPGEHNGWDTAASVLEDDNDDNIYTGTFTVAEADLGDDGVLQYKFWGTDPVGWEDDPNREFDPTEDATLDPVTFNKTFTDVCEAETETFEIVFRVDMSIQTSLGNFDPETDVVTVAGEFNGWNSAADTLAPLSSNPDVYVGLFQADLIVPSEQPYKYIIGEPEDASPDGWEDDPNKIFEVTGDEEDNNSNGIPEVLVEQRFFNDITPDDVLDAPATVAFNVDLRSAFQLLADSTEIPANAEATDFVTSIDGLFLNGPIAGRATSNPDGVVDWADWGPGALGSIPTRELSDDDEDGIYTITYEYDEGTVRRLPGKFGTDGYDNEAAGFNDHVFRIAPGTQTIDVVFGCMRKDDGTFEDDNGPGGEPVYDPYALIDLDATPQTCSFVVSGGEEDNPVGIEGTGVVPTTAELLPNYPNPFSGSTTFEYAVAEAGHVSLTVYDLMGRRVATLVDGVQPADTYRVTFDASALASGVYVTRLIVGDTVQSRKLTVTN